VNIIWSADCGSKVDSIPPDACPGASKNFKPARRTERRSAHLTTENATAARNNLDGEITGLRCGFDALGGHRGSFDPRSTSTSWQQTLHCYAFTENPLHGAPTALIYQQYSSLASIVRASGGHTTAIDHPVPLP
jgi:hypothetical protein